MRTLQATLDRMFWQVMTLHDTLAQALDRWVRPPQKEPIHWRGAPHPVGL